MTAILEGIFKGLVQWIFDLILEIVEYITDSLLAVFGMDFAFFETAVPVTRYIINIMMAVGWALLLGNLVFQAAKSMASGLGFEGEDPKLLFTRTFIFSFLLMVSRQICNVGLSMMAVAIDMLQVPTSVTLTMPKETAFSIGASWLLVIIVGIIIMWQVVKLFFEIGERYVVTALLTILAPLAFGMGGSKNTEDIFKGWARMYGSMCLMMVFNVMFLKLLLSALAFMPSGARILPWLILIVGIARVGRKIDSIVARIGLNPAITGDGLGRNLPGVLAYSVVRNLGSTVVKTIGKQGGKGTAASGAPGVGGPHDGSGEGPRNGPVSGGHAAGIGQKRTAYYHSGGGQSTTQPTGAATGAQTTYATTAAMKNTQTTTTAGTAAAPISGQATHTSGAPDLAQPGKQGGPHTSEVQRQGGQPTTSFSMAGKQGGSHVSENQQRGRQSTPALGMAGTTGIGPMSDQQSRSDRDVATRRSSVSHQHTPGVGTFAARAVLSGTRPSASGMAETGTYGPATLGTRPGSVGTTGIRSRMPSVTGKAGDDHTPQRPPIQRGQHQDGTARSGTSTPEKSPMGSGQTRFTAIPPQQGKPVAGGTSATTARYSSADHHMMQQTSRTTQSRFAQTGQDTPHPSKAEAAASSQGPAASTGMGRSSTRSPADHAQPTEIPTKQIRLPNGSQPARSTRSIQTAPGIGKNIQPPAPKSSPVPNTVRPEMGRKAGTPDRQRPSTTSKLAPVRQEESIAVPRQPGRSPSDTAGKAVQTPLTTRQGKSLQPSASSAIQGTARSKVRSSGGVKPPMSKDEKHHHGEDRSYHDK